MNKSRIITIIILFAFLSYITAIAYVYQHEKVHAEIFAHYGVSSKSTINFIMLSGATVAEDSEIDKCDDNCVLAQNINEVVGYQIAVIILSLWLIALFLVGAYIIVNKNSSNNVTTIK